MPKSLKERFADAVQNITTLEVITRVGDIVVTLEDGVDPGVTLKSDKPESGVYTRIDLVDGDTLNNFTPDMLEAPRAELRAFHQQAVKDAQGLIEKRVQLIKDLAAWLSGEVGELIKAEANKPSTG